MIKESTYIPVSELADLKHPQITWRVNLPDYAPAEDIIVDVRRLGSLVHLGGMENLKIASYTGDITQVTPEINTVDRQGVATATMKAGISKAETHQAEASTLEGLNAPYDYRWARGKVSLNIPEIDEIVARKSQLRDPKQWSKQLDKALRAGTRESSWESLVTKSTDKAVTPLMLATMTLMNTVFDGFNTTKLAIHGAECYTLAVLGGYHMANMMMGRDVRLRDRKHSLVIGCGLDRYFVVNALTRTQSLIKERKPRHRLNH